jgi:hypothetical protein
LRLWPGTFDRKSLPWRSRVERFVFRSLCDEQASGRMPPARNRFAPKLLTVCVILCSVSFAGCRRAIRRNVKSGPVLHEGKASPAGLPYAPVDTPNQFDMPNQKSGCRTWRC